jgi:hypothetical protein
VDRKAVSLLLLFELVVFVLEDVLYFELVTVFLLELVETEVFFEDVDTETDFLEDISCLDEMKDETKEESAVDDKVVVEIVVEDRLVCLEPQPTSIEQHNPIAVSTPTVFFMFCFLQDVELYDKLYHII